MNELSQKTIDRLKLQAYANVKSEYSYPDSEYDNAFLRNSEGYIAGSTAEASRALPLIEALEDIDMKLNLQSRDELDIIGISAIVSQAIKNYNKK